MPTNKRKLRSKEKQNKQKKGQSDDQNKQTKRQSKQTKGPLTIWHKRLKENYGKVQTNFERVLFNIAFVLKF